MEELREEFKKLIELRNKISKGDSEYIKKQHEKGKLTARERIDLLVDPGSFVEIGAFVTHRATGFGLETKKQLGDGVITGYGKINGRTVFIASQDFTFMGGSLGEAHAEKIVRVLDLAIKSGSPMIFLNDSGGARIQEGVDSLKGYGDIFYLNVKASGFIPQIAAILGPAAGGAVYSPALMDFIIMSRKNSYMFVTGPKVVKAAIGEEVDEYSLGGAEIHEQKSGVASLVGETEEEALNLIKKLLSYLPSNNREDPPYVKSEDPVERADKELDSIIPTDPNAPYDVKEVITRVLDKDTFFEIQPNWAQNAVIGFGRIGGRVVGIIANQPMYLAGSLDIDSSDKISRFIRFLDAFNISIITFVDVPGFLPGTVQEYGGVIRHGAKVIYAYSEATSPKITVIMRKAYGGAYIAMGSKHLGADYVLAYPFAEIAVMGPRGAVEILYGKELASLKDMSEKQEFLNRVAKEYRENITNPYVAASRGYIDDVIFPSETRTYLARALEAFASKKKEERQINKKHGIMPV